MKGHEAAALLGGLCVLLRGRDELRPETFALPGIRVAIEPSRPERGRGSRGGMSNAAKCRAYRQRKGSR